MPEVGLVFTATVADDPRRSSLPFWGSLILRLSTLAETSGIAARVSPDPGERLVEVGDEGLDGGRPGP